MTISGTHTSLSAQYLEFRGAAAHAPSCSRMGTDLWEVSRWTEHKWREDAEIEATVFRFFCSECKIIQMESCQGEPTLEWTTSEQAGYGSAPSKNNGLYLWAGPVLSFAEHRGPWSYYVTTSPQRPTSPRDVAGMVGWHETIRGGLRWSAGVGCTGYGSAERGAGSPFMSKGAAVRWIAEQLAAASAEASASCSST